MEREGEKKKRVAKQGEGIMGVMERGSFGAQTETGCRRVPVPGLALAVFPEGSGPLPAGPWVSGWAAASLARVQ